MNEENNKMNELNNQLNELNGQGHVFTEAEIEKLYVVYMDSAVDCLESFIKGYAELEKKFYPSLISLHDDKRWCRLGFEHVVSDSEIRKEIRDAFLKIMLAIDMYRSRPECFDRHYDVQCGDQLNSKEVK